MCSYHSFVTWDLLALGVPAVLLLPQRECATGNWEIWAFWMGTRKDGAVRQAVVSLDISLGRCIMDAGWQNVLFIMLSADYWGAVLIPPRPPRPNPPGIFDHVFGPVGPLSLRSRLLCPIGPQGLFAHSADRSNYNRFGQIGGFDGR